MAIGGCCRVLLTRALGAGTALTRAARPGSSCGRNRRSVERLVMAPASATVICKPFANHTLRHTSKSRDLPPSPANNVEDPYTARMGQSNFKIVRSVPVWLPAPWANWPHQLGRAPGESLSQTSATSLCAAGRLSCCRGSPHGSLQLCTDRACQHSACASITSSIQARCHSAKLRAFYVGDIHRLNKTLGLR